MHFIRLGLPAPKEPSVGTVFREAEASGGSPRLGGPHHFIRLGGDRLRLAARRGWWLCCGGYFVGGLPPFLIASPLPLSNAFFVRDFEGYWRGELVGFAFGVQKLKHLAISFADLKIHLVVVL